MNSVECDNSVGLICPSAIGTCNCPINSSSIFCECLRLNNNEFYWNGTACQPALSFNQSCSNMSSSYMCQTQTQGTICNGSGSIFTCQCPFLQYFNTSAQKCQNELTYNELCSANIMCQASTGLSCLIGRCRLSFFIHKPYLIQSLFNLQIPNKIIIFNLFKLSTRLLLEWFSMQ